MPLSAVASKKGIMEKWPKGAHGTTFGGNPVSCAAAVATIEIIEKEGLLAKAIRTGGHTMTRLRSIQERCPAIGDVRGLGLMIGIEFVTASGEPDTVGLNKVMRYCLEKGLVLLDCGVDKNIIRLAPPLVVKTEEIDMGLDIFDEALKAAYGV